MPEANMSLVCKNVVEFTKNPGPPEGVSAKVPLRSGIIVDSSEVSFHTVVLQKPGGGCLYEATASLQAKPAAAFFAVFLLAAGSMYIYTRLKTASPSVRDVHVRASFLVAAFLFLIATVALFAGIQGDLELEVAGARLSTAVVALALYLFGWLTWQGASRRLKKGSE